jgi:hypothetical protein
MTPLTIRRLDAEIASHEPADQDRVGRLLRRLAERTLDERRAGLHGLSGDWCVRRLDIELELDAAEPDACAAARWADLIAASVRSLVADGKQVIHYPNRSRALSELVWCLTTGRSERAWAWRQLGLLADFDPDPLVDPTGALLAALSREPQLAVGAVVDTVRRTGLARLDYLLGEDGWVGLAGIVASYLPLASQLLEPELMPADQLLESALTRIGHRIQAGAILANSLFADRCLASEIEPSPLVVAAWAALITVEVEPGRPRVAANVAIELARRLRSRRGSSLLADAESPWSGTDAGPADASSSAIGAIELPLSETQAATTEMASSAESGRAETSWPRGRAGDFEAPLPEADTAGRSWQKGDSTGKSWPEANTTKAEPQRPVIRQPYEGARELNSPPSPELHPSRRAEPEIRGGLPPTDSSIDNPEAEAPAPKPRTVLDAIEGLDVTDSVDVEAPAGAETVWAGLLFLLNTAEVAGIPDVLDEDARLSARPVRWTLHQLAQRLVPISATDPAALALAGLPPEAAAPAGPPPTDDEDIGLAELAGQWADVTREVLRESQFGDELPTMTIWSLARRTGRIVADPGWLEVHLGLDTVDIQVRSAGLDVNPGWVSWLGTVVRFCYV